MLNVASDKKPLLAQHNDGYVPLSSTDFVVVKVRSVYETACIPACSIINYDELPGRSCGKGCFGFFGCLPTVVSGIVAAGIGGVIATAAYYYGEGDNPNVAAAIGGSAALVTGYVASAIACYRNSMCCDGPGYLKVERDDIPIGAKIRIIDS